MKKIIVAFDNMHYSEGVMNAILHLHQMAPVSLTGIFLPQMEYSALWSTEAGAMAGSLFVPLGSEIQAETVRETISHFEDFCRKYHIRYTVRQDFFDFTMAELLNETRFADLLVLGSEAFYAGKGTEFINEFLQDVLHKSECPLLLVPEKYNYPQSNIIAYDGSEAAVFAIKQFIYLFPELTDRKTLIVYLNEDETATIPQEKKLKSLLSPHIDECAYLSLHIDARKYLTTWLNEQQGGLLICGAFGRSLTSQLFKRSFIADAITDHHLPVFIAHK
ncbi:hypothetical protein [Paraflavitalea pollutisoli]|uniref:hypothetical protein n=1 Tax=Paraflavitalea pollutisoli TaxID=3034143 RepID=UPI0023EDC4CA|nr:hypothetical protein [Paraflavitalea sp. H1-2-19X]